MEQLGDNVVVVTQLPQDRLGVLGEQATRSYDHGRGRQRHGGAAPGEPAETRLVDLGHEARLSEYRVATGGL